MTRTLMLSLAIAAGMTLALTAQGQKQNPSDAPVERLWAHTAPHAMGEAEADVPTLTLCPAPEATATGAAIVVCPGGGYGGLAMNHEGYDVARWLNDNGISAFILKYRVNPYRHPCPLLDAQRAIRTVRARAEDWKIDPQRIGILGFSAGGHLTSTAGTHFDAGDPNSDDPIEHVSCRPDFMVLVYPVISFQAPYTHTGSRKNLLGENPDPKLVELLSNERQVTEQTPPAFLIHTYNDDGVPLENSIAFFQALRKADIPAEMHLFEKGKHGFGLAPGDPVLSTWPELCINWMRERKFIP